MPCTYIRVKYFLLRKTSKLFHQSLDSVKLLSTRDGDWLYCFGLNKTAQSVKTAAYINFPCFIMLRNFCLIIIFLVIANLNAVLVGNTEIYQTPLWENNFKLEPVLSILIMQEYFTDMKPARACFTGSVFEKITLNVYLQLPVFYKQKPWPTLMLRLQLLQFEPPLNP